MEAKPLRIVPSSHNTTSGGGPQKKIEMGHTLECGDVGVDEGKRVVVVVKEEKKENSSSTVELDLGVDAAANSATQTTEEILNPVNVITGARHHQLKCCLLFTEAQRRELDHQVLIFNHFAYNLPLPPHTHHHLLQFPSNMMSEYTRLGFDYGTMVDPEPHRCRRTDGKKWRCSKNAVPDQKYCERHMHRGRNRSRKPVEASSQVNNSPLTTKPCGKSQTITKLAPNTESEVSNPNPLCIQPSDTSSCTPSRSFCVVNANNRSRNVMGSAMATAVVPKVTTFSSMASVASDNRSLNVCKNMNIKSGGKGSIVCDSNGISTGIGFSPRSVLQGNNIVSGCNHSYLNDRNSIEPEPGRCRRTDGKKWRCKSAVIPGQKYCATHMHRGAKKRFTNHEPAATTTIAAAAATTTTSSAVITTAQLPYSSAATNIQKGYCRIPNTNLSMSVPARASGTFIQCDEKSPSSSDTDTTITDTMDECSYVSF